MRLSARQVSGFWSRVADGEPEECWPWLDTTDRGYGVLMVRGNGRRRKLRAHRIAYFLTYGEPPPGFLVHHDCERRDCCNPAHLRPVTPSEHSALHASLRAAARERAEIRLLCGLASLVSSLASRGSQ